MNWKRSIRDLISRVLGFIPINYCIALRNSLASRTPIFVKQIILPVLRLRKIDQDIKEFALYDSPDLYLANDGSFITRQLFWYGSRGYEESETAFWRHLCHRSKKILELGANIGYYTINGAKASSDAQYVAVEPHPQSAYYLRENLSKNKIQNVRVIEAAVVGQKTCDSMDLFIPIGDTATPTGAYLGGGGKY